MLIVSYFVFCVFTGKCVVSYFVFCVFTGKCVDCFLLCFLCVYRQMCGKVGDTRMLGW